MTTREQSSPLMAVDSADSSNNAIHPNNGTDDVCLETENEYNTDSSSNFQLRNGTLSSASFNILSTMVGGGSLSLPLAFYQAGNGFMAPFLLLIIAALVEYSIYFLIEAAVITSSRERKRQRDDADGGDVDIDGANEENGFLFNVDEEVPSTAIINNGSKLNSILNLKKQKGTTSYESVACEAFGPKAKYFAMGLVFSICFFTIIGYGVLLRDMLLPLSDTIFPPKQQAAGDESTPKNDGPTFAHNAVLLFVMLLVTPLCTLRNLTALESVGALSMTSIFILAVCISYRSIECNVSSKYDDVRKMPWSEYVMYLPQSSQDESPWDNVLNALPILISVFMCHFNVLPVHNELKDPTPKRVNRLFRTTIWGAFIFYALVGFIGSMYGNCTPNGVVESNVLLSFAEDDILILIGRFCLSLTITFAFPILVVPARDTVLRGIDEFLEWRKRKVVEREESANNEYGNGEYRLADNDLSEPLLSDTFQENDSGDDEIFYDSQNYDHMEEDGSGGHNGDRLTNTQEQEIQMEQKAAAEQRIDNIRRIITSITIFWIGAIIACSVKDIDVIWDILGGSLSLIMGFTMPSATYLVLSKYIKKRLSSRSTGDGTELDRKWKQKLHKVMSWTLFILFIPLMFILTGNAVYNITNA